MPSRILGLRLPSRLVPLCGTLALIASSAPALAQQQALPEISQQALQQMQAIAGDKAQRTEPQKKIDSSLLYATREANGQAQFPNAPGLALPQLSARNLVGADGRVLVDITTTDATGLAAPIQALGGNVISSFPAYNAVRASLPIKAIEALAGNATVKNIRPAEVPVNNRITAPPRPSFKTRSDLVRVKEAIEKATNTGVQANVGYGPTKSEAIVAHGADIVQNAGVTGAGQKICVLSDGVDSLASRQAAGELPSVQILPGQAGSGDEGTAMLELVADMAPGATLGFASGFNGQAQMATNIINLRNSMGCTIIVDDVTYFAEAAFQEDNIANAVTTVVNSGAMYFSSAANSGHLTGGQSGTWEGDFVSGGAATGVLTGAGTLHIFDGAPFDTLTADTGLVSLKWSDPNGGSGNDYDLYVLDSNLTTIIGAGANAQTGGGLPFESTSCSGTCPAGSRIYIVLWSGAARALRLDTNRGRLAVRTNGSTYGHNAGVNTIGVAAISNNFTAISGRKFRSTDTTASYSSDGPRRLFLNPVPSTTPITAGCFLYSCGGGLNLLKPDISAADCNTTTTPDFIPFCGTSAAAPQAAAIAALVKSAQPSLTNAQVLARLKSTAIDIMAPGPDVDSGAGIIMADAAVNSSPSSSSAATHDFNGDNKSDIAWRATYGVVSAWLMNGSAVVGTGTLGSAPSDWQIVGQRDFNGDGKDDLLWRHSSGANSIWFLNGAAVTSAPTLTGVGTDWQVVGTGDFNGDGKGDIVWRQNGSGILSVWLMNGITITASAQLGGAPTVWQVAGVGDFNGDGKSDILFRHSNGATAIWYMNGTAVASASNPPGADTSWVIVGTGDFNGDGRADILWRQAGGTLAIWLMNGSSLVSSIALGGAPPVWQVTKTGDFNGDGKSDILFRHTGGAAAIWYMNGITVASASYPPGVGTEWTVQSRNAD